MKKKPNAVFIISVLISLFIIVYGIVANDTLASVSGSIMVWVSDKFGWLYVLSIFIFMGFLLWIAFSKYGKIKLGGDDEKPKYSNFNWFAMLFCGGTGIGLVFWSIAEPLSHYVAPPDGVEAGTREAAEFSIRTVFLHWGVTQWACFAIVGLGIAYFQFRKKKNAQISNLLSPLIGEKAASGAVGKGIDTFAIVVSVAGVATSLGLGVSQICGGLNYLLGIPNNKKTWFIVIFSITAVFLASSISGIDKGIKILSKVNTWIALILLAVVFAVGPHISMLNTFVNGLGQHVQNLVGDTLMINEFGDNSWVMNWRVFYYAWFIAWTPFVGMFIAEISRGRTIKEFIIGVVIAPTAFTIIWLSVFGTIALKATGTYSLDALAQLVASPETAVFKIFSDYPLSKVISGLIIILLAIFFTTSADSATYSLSVMSSDGDTHPPIYKKVIWAIIEAMIAFLLLSVGSIKPLQTISIAASLPFLFIMLAVGPALVKELRKDKNGSPGKGKHGLIKDDDAGLVGEEQER